MARALPLMVLLLLVTAMVVGAAASPWFDLFTNYRSRSNYPQRRPQNPGAGSRSGRDRFKSICRTVSPDNYAFPGRAPFPAAPICPY